MKLTASMKLWAHFFFGFFTYTFLSSNFHFLSLSIFFKFHVLQENLLTTYQTKIYFYHIVAFNIHNFIYFHLLFYLWYDGLCVLYPLIWKQSSEHIVVAWMHVSSLFWISHWIFNNNCLNIDNQITDLFWFNKTHCE